MSPTAHKLPIWAALPLAALMGLVFVSPAFCWTLSKSTNGVIVCAESSDSTLPASITVTRYWDYKGGSTWDSTYKPDGPSSYKSSDSITMNTGYTAGYEVDLKPGFRCQLVQVSIGGGGETARFAVLREPVNVSLEGTPTVSLDSTVAVEWSGASVSLDGKAMEYLLMAGGGAVLAAFAAFVLMAFRLTRGV